MGSDRNQKKRKAGKDSPESKTQEPETKGGMSRRTLLKSTASAVALKTLLQGVGGAALATAGASLIAPEKAHAQEAGLMPEGGTVPFRLPLGALDYLDRKDYIHNMKIISYLPGAMLSVSEPLLNMWAKGKRRVLPIAGGGFVDISNPKKPEVISRNAYKGFLDIFLANAGWRAFLTVPVTPWSKSADTPNRRAC